MVTVYQDAAMQDKRSVWAPGKLLSSTQSRAQCPRAAPTGRQVVLVLHVRVDVLRARRRRVGECAARSAALELSEQPMGPYGPPIQLTTDYGQVELHGNKRELL